MGNKHEYYNGRFSVAQRKKESETATITWPLNGWIVARSETVTLSELQP